MKLNAQFHPPMTKRGQTMKSTPKLLSILSVFLLLGISSLIQAENPEPQAPVNAPRPGEVRPLPELSINQDEISSGVMPELVGKNSLNEAEGNTSPMMEEIATVMTASRTAVAAMGSELQAIVDPATRLATQREIAQLKQQAELDILAIQARYAREGGNEELALQIETAITEILSPPAPVTPAAERPAPAGQR
jgi:hypothetical protein